MSNKNTKRDQTTKIRETKYYASGAHAKTNALHAAKAQTQLTCDLLIGN